MKFSTAVLAQKMQAAYYGPEQILDIKELSIDSRSLRNTEGTLFFALTGAHHNAHLFIDELLQKGVQYFVVEKGYKHADSSASFFEVEDTTKALHHFITYYRSLFSIPVIGITGSNGKTIVKEWLNFLLSPLYNIIKSPKSYNSQVGVPLSVVGINEQHTLGLFEAGVSEPNEMEALAQMIQPTIAVLTSIGTAHDEGFVSREQKIKEKLKLFQGAQLLVCEHQKEVLSLLPQNEAAIWDWSFEANTSARVVFETKASSILQVHFEEQHFEVNIPFSDAFSLHNTATCITTLLAMNVSVTYIQQWIPKLYPIELRLQVLHGKRDCVLIADTYSSDYQSLKIALDFMEQQKTNQQKTLILSDVFQSGFTEEVLYEKVAQLITQNQISKVIGIGHQISKHLKHLPQFQGFLSTASFLNDYQMHLFTNETLLVKGSRSFTFEKIITELEEKTHETVLEINLDAITHNLNFYKSKLQPKTKIMAMVKAFGYGNGSYEIAKHLAHLQVSYLGVAFADEGIELRKAGIDLPIIIMNPEQSAFSAMIAYQLEPEIYSFAELHAFLEEAQLRNLYHYPIHIKLNTGMNRLGFKEADLESLIALLRTTNLVKIESIFSHLATSDMPDEREFTLSQIALFDQWTAMLQHQLAIQPLLHILNTSGVYNYSEAQKDMVRLGIGLYGVGNDPLEDQQLENVATLKTIVLQLNTIEAKESVGYGRRFVAPSERQIATLPIGYADGIRRSYGNGKGIVFIRGKKAPIIGTICMDMLMIDVTDLDVKVGDEAQIFGPDFRITEVAKLWDTIPYEVMTSISHRVKRVFYKE